MLKVQRTANETIILTVIGQLQIDNIGELSTLLAKETDVRPLALDLKDLVLVDGQAVDFLRGCESDGVELRNCPSYVRAWISKACQ